MAVIAVGGYAGPGAVGRRGARPGAARRWPTTSAGRSRPGVRPRPSVSSLFGEPSLWSSSFVRDAQFAATAVADRSRDRARERRSPCPTGRASRSAAGRSRPPARRRPRAELFLGFADGKVLAFRPGRNQVVAVGEGSGPVTAVAADVRRPGRRRALHGTSKARVLAVFLRQPDGSFLRRPDVHFPRRLRELADPDPRDRCRAASSAWATVGELWSSRRPPDCRGPACRSRRAEASHDGAPAARRRDLPRPHPRRTALVAFSIDQGRSRFTPGSPDGGRSGAGRHPRCSVPLGATRLGRACQDRSAWMSRCRPRDAALDRGWRVRAPVLARRHDRRGIPGGGPGGHDKVVAVSPSRIDWLSDASDRFQTVRSIQDPGLAATVACFPSTCPTRSWSSRRSGLISRVGLPRRVRRPEPT